MPTLYFPVLFALLTIPLALTAATAAALIYAALYLVRCVNIARRHGA